MRIATPRNTGFPFQFPLNRPAKVEATKKTRVFLRARFRSVEGKPKCTLLTHTHVAMKFESWNKWLVDINPPPCLDQKVSKKKNGSDKFSLKWWDPHRKTPKLQPHRPLRETSLWVSGRSLFSVAISRAVSALILASFGRPWESHPPAWSKKVTGCLMAFCVCCVVALKKKEKTIAMKRWSCWTRLLSPAM